MSDQTAAGCEQGINFKNESSSIKNQFALPCTRKASNRKSVRWSWFWTIATKIQTFSRLALDLVQRSDLFAVRSIRHERLVIFSILVWPTLSSFLNMNQNHHSHFETIILSKLNVKYLDLLELWLRVWCWEQQQYAHGVQTKSDASLQQHRIFSVFEHERIVKVSELVFFFFFFLRKQHGMRSTREGELDIVVRANKRSELLTRRRTLEHCAD